MHRKSLVTFPVAVSPHASPRAMKGRCFSVPHHPPLTARGLSGVLISTIEKIPSLLPSLISVLEMI